MNDINIKLIQLNKSKKIISVLEISDSLCLPEYLFAHKNWYLYDCREDNRDQERRQNGTKCQKYHHK